MPTSKRERQRANRQLRQAQLAAAKRRRSTVRSSIIILVGVLVVGGIVALVTSGSPKKSASKKATTSTSKAASSTSTTAATKYAVLQRQANDAAIKAGCPANPKTRVNNLSWPKPPAMSIDTSKTYTATITTTVGAFTVDLLAAQAPQTVNSFVFLANQNYFHCVIFHRVITSFMDQTGDPTGTGNGGPGYTFNNENVPATYATGDVAMANSSSAHQTVTTNGSQFFVVVPGGAATLDSDLTAGYQFDLFGKVTSGMSVVEQINADGSTTGTPNVVQRILSVKITVS